MWGGVYYQLYNVKDYIYPWTQILVWEFRKTDSQLCVMPVYWKQDFAVQMTCNVLALAVKHGPDLWELWEALSFGQQWTDKIIVVPDFGFYLFTEDHNGHTLCQPLYILPLWIHSIFSFCFLALLVGEVLLLVTGNWILWLCYRIKTLIQKSLASSSLTTKYGNKCFPFYVLWASTRYSLTSNMC